MIRKAIGISRTVIIWVLTLATFGVVAVSLYPCASTHPSTRHVVSIRQFPVGDGAIQIIRSHIRPWSLRQGDRLVITYGSPSSYCDPMIFLFPSGHLGKLVDDGAMKFFGFRLAWQTYDLTEGPGMRFGNIMSVSFSVRWLVIFLAAYPMTTFIRGPLRRRRRRNLGLCLTCAYDRRGSPERCPECATKTFPGETSANHHVDPVA